MIELQGEIDEFTLIVGDFNSTLSEMNISRRRSQDGGIERPWAHLLPWAHQNSFTEQLLMRKNRKTAEKIFYNYRYEEGTTTILVEGREMWYSQDPYAWVGDTDGRIITIAEVLPKDKGV